MKGTSHHKLIPIAKTIFAVLKASLFLTRIFTPKAIRLFITYSVENFPHYCFSIFAIHSYPAENRGSEHASLSRKASNRSSAQNVQITFNYRLISSNVRVIPLLCKHYLVDVLRIHHTNTRYSNILL